MRYECTIMKIKIKELEERIAALEQRKPETITEFADRCLECGARYGKLLEQTRKRGISMEPIIPVLNLKSIIAETREFAQAVNEFADELERIEKKYGELLESEEDE